MSAEGLRTVVSKLREIIEDEWPVLVALTAVVLCFAIAAWCFMRVLK